MPLVGTWREIAVKKEQEKNEVANEGKILQVVTALAMGTSDAVDNVTRASNAFASKLAERRVSTMAAFSGGAAAQSSSNVLGDDGASKRTTKRMSQLRVAAAVVAAAKSQREGSGRAFTLGESAQGTAAAPGAAAPAAAATAPSAAQSPRATADGARRPSMGGEGSSKGGSSACLIL